MTMDFEVLAAIAMLGFFVWVIFRSGGANPVGTGQLQNQLNTVGSKVGTLEGKLAGCASAAELQQLREELDKMEGRMASSGEVLALGQQMAAVRAEIHNLRNVIDERHQARQDSLAGITSDVTFIKQFLMEKGLGGR